MRGCVLLVQVAGQAAVLGFVGSPWTLATYIVEGRSTRTYKVIKAMTQSDPAVLRPLLDHLATEIGKYMCYQIEAGADCIQIFDSWGGQLPPRLWDIWSKPYIQKVTAAASGPHPHSGVSTFARVTSLALWRTLLLRRDQDLLRFN